MTAGLAMPTQAYGLMLADPFTTADYTDITGLVKEWEGDIVTRQHELQLFQNGEVDFTLNNRDGRFSSWNTTGPYYNLVSPADDLTNGSAGVTVTCTNGAASFAVPPVVLDTAGNAVPKITANGTSPTSGTVTGEYAVVAGNQYTAMLGFLAGTTARACAVTITWYKSDGTTVISTTAGGAVNDATGAWAKSSAVSAVAPALAAFAKVGYTIASAANAEVHWLCRAALFNAVANVPNTAWAPGQRGLVPARQIQCTATWNSTSYPVFGMYVSNWTPQYGQVKSDQVVALKDGLALLAQDDMSSSAYADQVLADGATHLWRLGDLIGSQQAADSGPSNAPLTANAVQFGQASALLTDDTTTAVFALGTTVGSLTGGPTPAAGAQTIEFLFNMPVQSGQAQILAVGPTALGYIAWVGGAFLVSALPNGSGVTAGGTFSAPNADDGYWHHLVVTSSAATNGTLDVYLDGVLIGTSTASGGGSSVLLAGTSSAPVVWGAVSIPVGSFTYTGSLADIALYGAALTPTQVANHYALFSAAFAVQLSGQRIASALSVIGWPSALYSVATGVQQVQGATSSLTTIPALSYMQTVVSTEQGALFCDPRNYGLLTFLDRHYTITSAASTVSNCVLANDGAGGHVAYLPDIVPAMDDLDLWTDSPGQRVGGVIQRTVNALSAKQYVKRSLSGYTGLLQTNDNDVLAMTQWLIQHYDTPYTRVRQVTMSSTAGAGANLPQMLGRGALDRITVHWKPIGSPGDTALVQDSLIESVHHKVTQSEWVTTWGLAPADVQTYMILNDATLGRLSEGNLLAY